ncbi:flavin reductase family protein [Aestuariivirga litoralis]|uniref:flavin reductase family protein n=1 Tax=Aestuariivirga litoralis TaxID=2650924 RepID=UPI0018C691B2|nr:flavin reductase family protein [Aestuariivirga litoralis]MBG1231321.1 flavin reductase family protein [Aestuariivirga litoralis]
MFYETKAGSGLALDPFKAIVVPRPIGWISTLSASGHANLAPYSFFNAFAGPPEYVAFGSGGMKHTLANIEATGEFVVNLATYPLREAMNATSTHQQGDEFELAGLEKAPCHLVKPPRVAASPAALECRHFHTVPLPQDNGQVDDWLVIGRVVAVHIDDQFIKAGRVDIAAMQPLARLGYAEYATIDDIWRMRRPD